MCIFKVQLIYTLRYSLARLKAHIIISINRRNNRKHITGGRQGRIQSRGTVGQAISRGHLLGMKLN
jgi:hypothetical protein